jgi:hypothetical protein|tara:strand:- start:600 stop:1001 length:402 start_codon:yes stop_codon:yes gene_type:complete
MAIGEWEPETNSEKPQDIDHSMLQRFIELIRDGHLEDLADHLSGSDRSGGAFLMKLEQPSWDFAEQYSDEEIEHLIRFFTLAEQHVSGWQGGKRSPVIWLVKILKKRQAFAAELSSWIKSHTDNRYLPYGSIF